MPICNHCLEEKDPEEFNWRYKELGIRHPTCRECQKPFRKNWYEGSAKRIQQPSSQMASGQKAMN